MRKPLFLFLLAGVWVASAVAQGTVNFCNLNGAAGLNVPVYASDGTTKLSGPVWTAELLAGPSANDLASVALTGFLTGGGAGYFQGGAVNIASVAPGATAFLEVRVFATALGSYAAAEASAIPGTWGASAVFSVTTGGAGTPPTVPAALTGMPPVLVVPIPEPGCLALLALGFPLLSLRRRWAPAVFRSC